MNTIRHSRGHQRGQNFSEYGVVVALIAVLIIGGVGLLGGSVSAALDNVGSKITVITNDGGTLVSDPTATPTLPLGDQSGSGSQPLMASIAIYPSSFTIIAGATQTYTAEGTDPEGNSLDVTDATTFSIDDGTCIGNVCSSLITGDHSVSGTYGSSVGSADLIVEPTATPTPEPTVTPISADVSITSGPLYSGNYSLATYSFAVSAAGGSESLSYAWAGPDSFNSLDDQNPTYTFSCTELPGTVSVSVTDAIEQSAVGSVSLTACPSVASIAISPGTTSIVAGSTQTYTATSFDANGNSLGDVTGYTTFTISGSGTCSVNACGSTVAGSYTVTATDASLTASATLTVNAGPLDSIVISPPGTTSIVAGSTQTYTTTGFDANGNSLGDVTGSTTFYMYGSGPTHYCSANVCAATFAGYQTVVALDAGLTDTAHFMVSPGTPVEIYISPITASIVAGGTKTFTTVSTDAYGNNADATSDTTFTISGGTCSANVCGSTVAGSHIVTATDGNVTEARTLTVTAGPLASIVISPKTASIVAGSTQTYTAAGFDANGNSLGNVTGYLTGNLTISGGTCSANVCGSTVAGSHTVTAIIAGLTTDTATLTVTAGAITSFSLTAAMTTLGTGVADNLTITARDAYGNTATSYTGSHSLTFSGASVNGTTHPAVVNSSGATINFGAATAITFTNGSTTVTGPANGVMRLYTVETAHVVVSDGSHTNGTGLTVTVTVK
jgi:Flp pilus assembly pilin Flp